MKKYLDKTLSFKERAKALVAEMTLDEKISQTLHESPGIERLGIPPHNWWSEALHGVARNGVATVFPQSIGLAAAWDPWLIEEVGDVISTEARAKHHAAAAKGDYGIYKGLTYWSPNINIFRDPRWGRGQETYGEDPYLTARTGEAFIRGLQGDDPKYLKVSACAKHFAAHSGPESKRHHMDTNPPKKDFFETYLPAFEAAVKAGVESVMTAYTRLYDEPCSGNEFLLKDILRGRWGFDGHVVSDCGAVEDFHVHQKVTSCTAESAGKAVRAGCDLNCGYAYSNLAKAVDEGWVTEEEITQAVERLMVTRLKLGLFAGDDDPYADMPYELVDCDEHRELALQAAEETVTMVVNRDSFLPVNPFTLQNIAVIGPNAADPVVLLGNYNGFPSRTATMLSAVQDAVPESCRVWYAKGCGRGKTEDFMHDNGGITEAVKAAEMSDMVILVVGLDSTIEGEEGDAFNSDAGGDRGSVFLTGKQYELIEAVNAVGKPVVIVAVNGGPVAIDADKYPAVKALLYAYYGGQSAGTAVANVIFGSCNPAGRLPYTVVRSVEDLPDFEDYSMEGRTYRYFPGDKTPLYPFGFGFGFSRFGYDGVTAEYSPEDETVEVACRVTNQGPFDGDEVVQVYITRREGCPCKYPVRQLAAFERVYVKAGETEEVYLTVDRDSLCYYNDEGEKVFAHGSITLSVGGSQGDKRSLELGAPANTEITVEI
ncbi:MAG: glycoside hydrolase family 3 C-terminal domain-containing protein [Abditibacteriota bacterium]|nr:glycoside hydrolase family 3 C-terminal domain-containing protein [Abditibacteriota bacterium]